MAVSSYPKYECPEINTVVRSLRAFGPRSRSNCELVYQPTRGPDKDRVCGTHASTRGYFWK